VGPSLAFGGGEGGGRGIPRLFDLAAGVGVALLERLPVTAVLALELAGQHPVVDLGQAVGGATVGPVDPEHMFYLRSRGIPEQTAKRMLIQGFFGDVLDRIPFEHARKLVEAELESRIG